MKRSRKVTIGLISLFSLTAVGVFGTTAGTLAWYIYSRSTGFSFVGTSVAKSVLLNIGIIDDNNYISDNIIDTYDLKRESHDGHSIVFTQASSGLDYHVIKEYLFWTEYNSSMLFPVTTKARALSDTSPLTLYKSPDFGDTVLTAEAEKSDYVKIPFAFQVNSSTQAGYVDTDIWLTDSIVKASGKNIDKAVRIFVENDQRRFLFKPSDTSLTNGYTNVGGLLDLNKDGFYDYDSHDREMFYGDNNGGAINYNGRYPLDEDEADYDNVNGVSYLHQSTFYAKHKKDIYTVDFTNLIPSKAEYYSFGAVKPLVDDEGSYYAGDSGIKICSTDGPTGVGYATFTIFLEGWDHVVIDEAAGYNFSLNLRFEINRL